MTANNIVIRGNTTWSRFKGGLAEVVPNGWRALVHGPATTISIGPDGASLVGQYRRLRPIRVLLQPGLVLKRRLTLPSSASADLASSVELMVLAETPFEPKELLIHAQALDHAMPDGDVTYDVHMTPRDRLEEGLGALGLARSRVDRIDLADTPSPENRFNLAPALGGANRILRLGSIVSCAVLLIALVVIAQTYLGTLRHENAVLEAVIAEQEETLRPILADLEQQRGALLADAEIQQLLRGSPSAFLLLEQLRSALPADAVIGRLWLDDGELRFDTRAPEMLQLIRALTAAMPTWVISVDGAIARSPEGLAEQATILFEPRPPS